MVPQAINQGSPVNTAHPLNRGLVAWWMAMPAAGVCGYGSLTWRDLCRGNHGTLTNGPAWGGGSGLPNGAGAVTFDGVDDFISVPTLSHGTTFSVACVVKYANANQNGTLLIKEPVNSDWIVFFEGGLLKQRSNGVGSTISVTAPVANVWHQFVAVYAGTALSLYVDGLLATSGTVATTVADGAGVVGLGRFNSGYYYTGQMSQASIWANRALTAGEVAQLYTQSRLGSPDTLSWIPSRAMVAFAAAAAADDLMPQCWC